MKKCYECTNIDTREELDMGSGELTQKKKNLLGKWVFTIKYKVDGTFERYISKISSKMLYTDLWDRQLGNICSNSQYEHCVDLVVLNYLLSM